MGSKPSPRASRTSIRWNICGNWASTISRAITWAAPDRSGNQQTPKTGATGHSRGISGPGPIPGPIWGPTPGPNTGTQHRDPTPDPTRAQKGKSPDRWSGLSLFLAKRRSENLPYWRTISTRRFWGSRTPSPVGTSGSVSPLASVKMPVAGKPMVVRTSLTAAARRSLRPWL